MKITFYGKSYFTDQWNLFDFICLGGIIIFSCVFLFAPIGHNPLIVLLTLFRVAKLMTLFRLLKVLRRMLQTTLLAFPSAASLALLIIIVTYIFGVIGVILFAHVKHQASLNANANFTTLLNAFLAVFRIATGDNWVVLMHDLMQTKTQSFDCVSFPTYKDIANNNGIPNGCGEVMGAIYCIMLVVIINFVFLNLFVAIVVASMLEINELSESVLSDDILKQFQNAWSNYDPNASGFIEYFNLWNFLCDLGKPLGICKEEIHDRYFSAMSLWMLDLNIYYYESQSFYYIEFYDVLEALVKKTIYKPQTLNKIFHNKSKDDLIEGLQQLWSEKSRLVIGEQENLGKIEALSYYYKIKNAYKKKNMKILQRAQMPVLVWVILRITRTLKLLVRKRKRQYMKFDESSTGTKDLNELKFGKPKSPGSVRLRPSQINFKSTKEEGKVYLEEAQTSKFILLKQETHNSACTNRDLPDQESMAGVSEIESHISFDNKSFTREMEDAKFASQSSEEQGFQVIKQVTTKTRNKKAKFQDLFKFDSTDKEVTANSKSKYSHHMTEVPKSKESIDMEDDCEDAMASTRRLFEDEIFGDTRRKRGVKKVEYKSAMKFGRADDS